MWCGRMLRRLSQGMGPRGAWSGSTSAALVRAAGRRPMLRLASSSTTVSLSNLRPAPGSNKPRKRVGRGLASGGRTCGRGNSGQKSRSGPGIPRGFEGGQTPFHFRHPKRGFRHPDPLRLTLLPLDRLQHLIDTGRLSPHRPITIRDLSRAGLQSIKDGVKIMARGSQYFCSKIVIQATRFSQRAIQRIEELGGTAVAVYHDDRGMLQMLRPTALRIHPSLPLPKYLPPMKYKERLWYSSHEQRGYLNREVRERLRQVDPNFEDRYLMVEPLEKAERPNLSLRAIPATLRAQGIIPA